MFREKDLNFLSQSSKGLEDNQINRQVKLFQKDDKKFLKNAPQKVNFMKLSISNDQSILLYI